MCFWSIAAAFFAGCAASLGIGGGGILLLYLLLALNMAQLSAQGINLIFFLPCALLSILLYCRQKRIVWQAVIPIIIGGVLGVGPGAYLANIVAPGILAKAFGGFLLLLGLRELLQKKPAQSESDAAIKN